MSNYSKTDTDLIKSQTLISEVIGKYVEWDKKKTNVSRGDYWACCPFHGEKSPSFHCENTKGFYHCFGCGQSGDHFKFLMDYEGISFPEAIRRLGGEEEPLTPEQKQEWARKKNVAKLRANQQHESDERDKQKRVDKVQKIWHSARSIQGTPADTYLTSRIAEYSWPPSLKYHPSLPCETAKEAGLGLKHPALIAAVQGVDRKLVALWRIFLTNEGKALEVDGKKVKLGLGPSKGGMVRLTPVTDTLNVGEGLESTLGAMALSGFVGSWAAALSTSGMRSLQIPKPATKVHFWSDGDRSRFTQDGTILQDGPGQSAATDRAQRAITEKYESFIHNPPIEGEDWLDVWIGQRNFNE